MQLHYNFKLIIGLPLVNMVEGCRGCSYISEVFKRQHEMEGGKILSCCFSTFFLQSADMAHRSNLLLYVVILT